VKARTNRVWWLIIVVISSRTIVFGAFWGTIGGKTSSPNMPSYHMIFNKLHNLGAKSTHFSPIPYIYIPLLRHVTCVHEYIKSFPHHFAPKCPFRTFSHCLSICYNNNSAKSFCPQILPPSLFQPHLQVLND